MARQRLIRSPKKRKRGIARSGSQANSARLFHGEVQSPVLQLQRMLGNQRVAQLIQAKRLTLQGKILGLQPKLTVSAAADQFEQEADHVASQVLSMPDAAAANSMQRAIAPDEDKDRALQTKPLTTLITPGAQRQIRKDDAEGKAIHAKSGGSPAESFEAGAGIESQVSLSKGHGGPLPDPVRAYMEPRFGVDFSQVRVHTGGDAIQMNRDVGAQAFTHGSDIYFGAGHSPTELGLTAHELTHVVQQTGGVRNVGKRGTDFNSSQSFIQRRIGDGHDLTSPRFSGDPVLEACFDNERLLRFGAQGDAVQKLQQALVDAGFPLPKFGVDGIFGSETRTAVRNFQQTSGISIDGLVGPQTMGALDARFSGPTPPGPTPPGPAPPGPAPAPPEAITSETVALTPGARTRTTIGVGEEVNLTHTPGSAAWTTTAGTLSTANGPTSILSAPDTAQRITVNAGAATISFDVIAPTSVAMDREPGTGVKHTLNQPDSGIQTRVFLGPDTVNFNKVIYHELDVAGVPTNPGVYSCNTFSTGHCGAGGGGAACPDKAVTNTVVAGMGTQSVLGDCAYSGHCGTAPPFVPGSIALSIPYEYKVGAGAFHAITNVPQVHALAADASTLTSDKAGAHGDTTVAAAAVIIPQCP